jgi:hypothetical protein
LEQLADRNQRGQGVGKTTLMLQTGFELRISLKTSRSRLVQYEKPVFIVMPCFKNLEHQDGLQM